MLKHMHNKKCRTFLGHLVILSDLDFRQARNIRSITIEHLEIRQSVLAIRVIDMNK
jgi:hypothetical protein